MDISKLVNQSYTSLNIALGRIQTHCGLTHIMYYVMLHHFVQCIFDPFGISFFIFRILGKNPKSLLQFLEKLLLQFLEKTFLQFLGKYFLESSKHLIIVMFKVSMRPNPIVEFNIQNSNQIVRN